MKNETEFIKSTAKRELTAKASKFLFDIIRIVAKNKGFSSWMIPEFKPTKIKIENLINDLFFDKKMSINEIKEIIKNTNKLG